MQYKLISIQNLSDRAEEDFKKYLSMKNWILYCNVFILQKWKE